jgi:hypothetical protein
MTKKKPGAKMGRPRGTSPDAKVMAGARISPATSDALDAEALAQGKDRSAIIREILERWAKRRSKA